MAVSNVPVAEDVNELKPKKQNLRHVSNPQRMLKREEEVILVN